MQTVSRVPKFLRHAFDDAGWPLVLRLVCPAWCEFFDLSAPPRLHVLGKRWCRSETKPVLPKGWLGLEAVDFVPECSDLQEVHTLDLSWKKVDVSALGGVHTLCLKFTDVIDVSALGGVHTLYLGGTRVADVSMLGDVHTLDLSYTEVADVSMLGGVHTLDLRWTRVSDVSMLGGVRKLYLSRTCVSDVSALGGVHTLDLRRTKVVDVSALGGVHKLWLPDGTFVDRCVCTP